MSNNISDVQVLSSTVKMKYSDIAKLVSKLDLPEICFLSDIEIKNGSGSHPIKDFDWVGMGSANLFYQLTDEVIPKMTGKAELIFTWEDGSQSGLYIEDGKSEECQVLSHLKRSKK